MSADSPPLVIGVLGEVTASVGGRPVDLGGPRQRAVLAVLVAARGDIVPTARLIDGVWPDRPPANAAGAVQAYVSPLRRALEPDRTARDRQTVIAHRPPGYTLARTARAEAGTLWLDVMQEAGPLGLTALHGSSPDVGVAGYSLGGGIGWYARRLGLQANNVTAIEVVTADGTLVRADAGHETDLFWALRGGGGNFGVVTALEFGLFPIATAYAGLLAWDATEVEPVLRRWRDWAAAAPDEVTTSLRVLKLPPLPELPEPFRGRNLIVVDGAVLGDDAAAERVLAPLRELRPEIDTFARVPSASLIHLHMDPDGPTPTFSTTARPARRT